MVSGRLKMQRLRRKEHKGSRIPTKPQPPRHPPRGAHLQREREPDDDREDEAREEGEADLLDQLGGEVGADRVEAVGALALEERALEHDRRHVPAGERGGEGARRERFINIRSARIAGTYEAAPNAGSVVHMKSTAAML